MLTDKELFTHLVKQRGHQTAAWDRVIAESRKLAQMKAHGSYDDDHGHAVTINFNERARWVAMFTENLLRAVDQAYAEDARMGATISSITQG